MIIPVFFVQVIRWSNVRIYIGIYQLYELEVRFASEEAVRIKFPFTPAAAATLNALTAATTEVGESESFREHLILQGYKYDDEFWK